MRLVLSQRGEFHSAEKPEAVVGDLKRDDCPLLLSVSVSQGKAADISDLNLKVGVLAVLRKPLMP